jgi:hypothetical protein
MKMYGEVEGYLHHPRSQHQMEVLLPLNPPGNSPYASPQYPLYKRLGGPQSQSGLYGEEKNPLPLPGIELQPSSL